MLMIMLIIAFVAPLCGVYIYVYIIKMDFLDTEQVLIIFIIYIVTNPSSSCRSVGWRVSLII